MTTLKIFLTSFLLFIVLDAIWFSLSAQFYRSALSGLARIVDGKFLIRFLPAIACYVLMAISVAVFLIPVVATHNGIIVFALSALFGVIVYGVYDFTNAATLSVWPLRLIVVDMAWGAIAYTLNVQGVLWVLKNFNF